MRQNPSEFHNNNRAYNKTLKTLYCNVSAQNLRKHEKAFKYNPWVYSKKLCTLGTSSISPACTPDDAYKYVSNITNESSHYQSLPLWIDEVWPAPDPEDLTPFDLSPITPGLVKRVLKKRSSNYSPGEDGISYHHLKKVPSSHHFLATLFTKILLKSHSAPPVWRKAKIKLLFKGGDSKLPSNFRPIALTSTIGKLFHKILATRLGKVPIFKLPD